MDGAYEVRARTVCSPSPLTDPPDGMDEAVTEVLVGAMDRVQPQRFGLLSEPADGVYAPGDEISIAFDEAVVREIGRRGVQSHVVGSILYSAHAPPHPRLLQDCRQPFNFFITMTIARNSGEDLEYDEDQVQVVCQENKISLQFAPTLSLDDLQDSTGIHVAIMGVRDLVGNAMSGIITWHFTVRGEGGGEERERERDTGPIGHKPALRRAAARLALTLLFSALPLPQVYSVDLSTVSASLTDVVLQHVYNETQAAAGSAAREEIAAEIARLLEVDVSRIEVRPSLARDLWKPSGAGIEKGHGASLLFSPLSVHHQITEAFDSSSDLLAIDVLFQPGEDQTATLLAAAFAASEDTVADNTDYFWLRDMSLSESQTVVDAGEALGSAIGSLASGSGGGAAASGSSADASSCELWASSFDLPATIGCARGLSTSPPSLSSFLSGLDWLHPSRHQRVHFGPDGVLLHADPQEAQASHGQLPGLPLADDCHKDHGESSRPVVWSRMVRCGRSLHCCRHRHSLVLDTFALTDLPFSFRRTHSVKALQPRPGRWWPR